VKISVSLSKESCAYSNAGMQLEVHKQTDWLRIL